MEMMEMIISDIRKSLENKCYYAALALTLTLPDICGSVEYPSYTDNVPKRYIEWAEEYIGKFAKKENPNDQNSQDSHLPYLSGEIIYNIRNKFLHRGELTLNRNKVKDNQCKVDYFLFVIGDASKLWSFQMSIPYVKDGSINYQKGMLYDITYFCRLITNCAEQYYRNNMDKFHFDCNMVSEEELWTDTFGKE